jgi:hypothetical protein
VCKAYFSFTDAELLELDRWVRNHTVNRFGPVREVERGLVLEVAFEGLQRSTRHRSRLAIRFPRISRIRWDRPALEADRSPRSSACCPHRSDFTHARATAKSAESANISRVTFSPPQRTSSVQSSDRDL